MKKIIFCIFLNFSLIATAQEMLVPLPGNPILQNIVTSEEMLHKTQVAIKLPFFDDFSWSFLYPDSSLWADRYTFINDGFCRNGITIGCATLDAYDKYGRIYQHLSSYPMIADTLTSINIRLDSIFVGIPKPASIADSLYLSFFFQPQGFGEKPETADSLLLQFYNPFTSEWKTVWSHPGMSYNQFVSTYNTSMKIVMIPIRDSVYLKPNFKFRFLNYASISNNNFPTWLINADHWNIDYVYLNASRNKNDTILPDVAFRSRIQSLLKTYSSMPWSHFMINSNANMIQAVAIPYKNYSNTLLNLTERLIIKDLSGTTPGYNSGIVATNLSPLVDTVFIRQPFPYTFNSLVSKNAEFMVQFCINTNTIADLIRHNDTVQFYQRFYNYFAYEDGTAEMGYVVMGGNARVAQQFILSHPDTLRSVQFFFPSDKNGFVSDLFFTLIIWNDQNGKPGQIIYQEPYLKPINEGLNKFHTYVLKEPIAVSGTIYVGYQQLDENGIVLGFDKNTNISNKIFYSTSNVWNQTMYEGALLIRIIVGDTTHAYQSNDSPEIIKINVFPNPVKVGQKLTVELPNCEFKISLYNSLGQNIHQCFGVDRMSLIWSFEPGIYALIVEGNGQRTIKKILSIQ